jgi:hypothetical protein
MERCVRAAEAISKVGILVGLLYLFISASE